MDDGFSEEYSAPLTPVPRPPARPFRWLKRLAIGLSILLLLVVAAVTVVRYVSLLRVRARTAEIVARLDQIDPDWRLEKIEAARKVIPDDRNSALPLIAALQLLPKAWPETRAATPERDRRLPRAKSDEQTIDNLIELGLVFRPDEAQVAVIRAELDALKPALAEARKAADLDEGRYRLDYARDPFQTLLPHTQNSRTIAKLLKLDAIRRAHDGDADGAIASCRALLNVGRSIGDEPMAISQLVRNADQFVAIRTLEVVLSVVEPSDEALAAMQRLLEAEDGETRFRLACRGERGALNDYYARVISGEISPAKDNDVPAPMWWLWGEWMWTYAWGEVLEEMNEIVAFADAPVSKLRERMETWESGYTARVSEGFLAKWSRLLLPAMRPLLESTVMSRGRLRAAIVAVAAERYRRKHGKWPESAEQLVPWPLTKVPTDPCTDEPLIWQNDEGSLVIYSTGPDLEDDFGALEQEEPSSPSGVRPKPRDEPYWQGKDFGFRLHDPAERRPGATKEPE